MKKKQLKMGLLVVLLLAASAYFIVNRSTIETSAEIENNEGNSISYLSEEDEESVLKVFNFDQEKLTKVYGIKQEKDIYSSSFYNTKEQKTIITTQQLDPYGYQVYIQGQSRFQSLGLLKDRVQEVVLVNDSIFALVYAEDGSLKLNKYDSKQLENPIKSWNIEGSAERMLLDEGTQKIHILTTKTETHLFTLDISSDKINSKKILNHAYDLNAYIEKGQLWLLLREKLDPSNTKTKNNQEKKSLVLYDLAKGVPVEEYPTEYQPKFIQTDQEKVYVISGSPNTSYLEIYDRKNMSKSEKTIKLKANGINGFVSMDNVKFIFTNKGVYKIQGGTVEQLVEEKISPNTDLVIR